MTHALFVEWRAAFVPFNQKSQQPCGHRLDLFWMKSVGVEVMRGRLGESIEYLVQT